MLAQIFACLMFAYVVFLFALLYMFYSVIFSHRNILALNVSSAEIPGQTTFWVTLGLGDMDVYHCRNQSEKENTTYLYQDMLCHVSLI